MKRLEGKIGLVTGGAKGIGRAIVEAFAREGASVGIIDLPGVAEAGALVERLRADGVHARAFEASVADDEAVRAAVQAADEEFGRIDILVNNAGIARRVPFLELTPDIWDQLMNVNLRGMYLVTRHVVPIMQRGGGGRIINLASQMGQRGVAFLAHYCAAKAGVIGLTKALARELAPSITVNAIAPGPIHTDITAGREPSWYENITAEMPLRRMGTVEDVAPTAVFLASADGDFYTGQTLGPNGGHVML
jgi:3-oxoacyl-[acyl-carrier protein] reductase